MKKLQCTKCKTVFWNELKGIDENILGRGEWIQNPCPKCGYEWAAVEIEERKLKPGEGRRLLSEVYGRPTLRAFKEETVSIVGKSLVFPKAHIRKLRKNLGISQKGLASLVGVTPGAVANWERGKFKPMEEKVREMVALLSKGKADVQKILAGKISKMPIEKKPEKAVIEKIVRKKVSKKKGV